MGAAGSSSFAISPELNDSHAGRALQYAIANEAEAHARQREDVMFSSIFHQVNQTIAGICHRRINNQVKPGDLTFPAALETLAYILRRINSVGLRDEAGQANQYLLCLPLSMLSGVRQPFGLVREPTPRELAEFSLCFGPTTRAFEKNRFGDAKRSQVLVDKEETQNIAAVAMGLMNAVVGKQAGHANTWLVVPVNGFDPSIARWLFWASPNCAYAHNRSPPPITAQHVPYTRVASRASPPGPKRNKRKKSGPLLTEREGIKADSSCGRSNLQRPEVTQQDLSGPRWVAQDPDNGVKELTRQIIKEIWIFPFCNVDTSLLNPCDGDGERDTSPKSLDFLRRYLRWDLDGCLVKPEEVIAHDLFAGLKTPMLVSRIAASRYGSPTKRHRPINLPAPA
ncbi:hypothetical protein GGTG_04950 [Gaeumannomyces tritici R3-111a-1]|uniref:Uncharacterized protein n=1 Tax=Gaeumannomyces tritici (strain R3-111a-1) TaxID=644352 RepID=J3NUJ4_GAET3|nr:hypothetical protein GGTG_04950 [Gaeumannomyces tritici R3-111a-1]EJT79867.1 hypothetical protein GGTG_04950 [Gaeumannomyces tritici R3-111a-1]